MLIDRFDFALISERGRLKLLIRGNVMGLHVEARPDEFLRLAHYLQVETARLTTTNKDD
jgi:hypothetical protein